jgi:hypothetical protein
MVRVFFCSVPAAVVISLYYANNSEICHRNPMGEPRTCLVCVLFNTYLLFLVTTVCAVALMQVSTLRDLSSRRQRNLTRESLSWSHLGLPRREGERKRRWIHAPLQSV